jgi:enoyl-CoA hydratase
MTAARKADEDNYETLLVERADGVATVTLNRPPVNAVNRTMQLELTRAFDALSQDRGIGAVILTGSGDRAFSAGIDLDDTARHGPAGERGGETPLRALIDDGWEWRHAQHAVHHCAVPVIAAVEGAAVGAGFGLVGVCDLIVASERARFALTEINVGLLGGSSKAIRMIGPYKARMMMFGGEFVEASEFHRLGAVEAVVAPGQALAHALAIGRKLATKSPLALRLAKESILRIEDGRMERDYRTEQDYTHRLRGFQDSSEALASYREKRQPHWTWS